MRAIATSQSDGTASRSPSDNGLTDCNEERLVAEAKGGSHVAFEKLFESYRATIFRMARMVAQTHEDAEDVIQQSFHKAFVHLRSFEGRSSFTTWLTRIALNEALMLKRGNQRFRHVSIEDFRAADNVAPVLEIADLRPNPEHSFFQRERQRLLLSAIDKLKPGMRTVVQIHDLHEQSVRDTAQVLGVSLSAVKSRIHRGRKQLRDKLKTSCRSATNKECGPSRRNRTFQFVG